MNVTQLQTDLPSDYLTHKPVIAVSDCVLGKQVRYDGGHKRSRFVTDQLSQFFEFRGICPEVGIGLGTPRSPIRLVQDAQVIRAKGVQDSNIDVTDELVNYAHQKLNHIDDIAAYILKAKSPSCGMERVPVYTEQGNPTHQSGPGAFAKALMEHRPELPIEEDGRLNDPQLRENFIERAYIFDRWLRLKKQGLSSANIIAFHSAHKYTLMAHNYSAYKTLGGMVANIKDYVLEDFAQDYIRELMQALKTVATRKSHTNVLMHLMGYFKNNVDSEAKSELLYSIENYRAHITTIEQPLTLIRHYLRLHPKHYLQAQSYFYPHPEALALRSFL